MKNVKLILSAILLSSLFSVGVQAQEKAAVAPEKSQEAKSQGQQNVDRLGLTDEQQRSFREIIKRYAEQMRDVRKSVLTKEEKLTRLNEINLNRDAEVKVLLKEEQYKTYLQLQQERRAKMIDMKKKQ